MQRFSQNYAVYRNRATMEKIETISFHRRNLPHWHVKDGIYFVTICLKGSVPLKVINRYKMEYKKFLDSDPDETAILEYQRKHFQRIEKLLDSGQGSKHLSNPEIAKLVMDSFNFLEDRYHWQVPTAVVMPSHIHLLLCDSEKANQSLEKSLGAFKGYTGRMANKILGQQGAFWMPENFDHRCRTPEKVESVKRYIQNNPVKARLVKNVEEWPWIREK